MKTIKAWAVLRNGKIAKFGGRGWYLIEETKDYFKDDFKGDKEVKIVPVKIILDDKNI
jgi:dihydrofolate reductase